MTDPKAIAELAECIQQGHPEDAAVRLARAYLSLQREIAACAGLVGRIEGMQRSMTRLAALETEIERLNQEVREQTDSAIAHMQREINEALALTEGCTTVKQIAAERFQMQTELVAMRVALKKYGSHFPLCDIWVNGYTCSCGLAAALKPADDAEEPLG